jgi:hypothetical protein
MKQKFVFLLFVCAMLFSCKKNTTTGCNLTSFPAAVGNSWTYIQTTQLDYDNIRDTVLYDTIHLEVIKDTIYKGKTMQKIVCYSNKNPYKSYSVCINENSSFMQYMSEPGFISEIFRTMQHSTPKNNLFDDTKISTPDSSLNTILNFNGDKWVYIENDLVKIEKESIGEESISVPKGEFQCCKYKFNYLRKFFPQSIDIIEYFSDKGLIKKITNSFNVDFTDNAGNPTDTGDSYITIELIDYTIN